MQRSNASALCAVRQPKVSRGQLGEIAVLLGSNGIMLAVNWSAAYFPDGVFSCESTRSVSRRQVRGSVSFVEKLGGVRVHHNSRLAAKAQARRGIELAATHQKESRPVTQRSACAEAVYEYRHPSAYSKKRSAV